LFGGILSLPSDPLVSDFRISMFFCPPYVVVDALDNTYFPVSNL